MDTNPIHPIMTGSRKSNKAPRKKAAAKQQPTNQTPQNQTSQNQNQPDDIGSPPVNIKKEQPPTQQVVKKILKAENDEAKTLKTVFKSNPDSQMKEFIKIAAKKPTQPGASKAVSRTPAENHPPAVAQELLETDDDVADNLARLFKASKSFKNL